MSGQGGAVPLCCSLCMFLPVSYAEPQPAVTVINGQAVCLKHVDHVRGGEHEVSLRDAYRPRATTVVGFAGRRADMTSGWA